MKTRRILAILLALVTILSCMSIVAFADDNTANLDMDTNKSKDIDQNYTFKQTGDTTYTDVYKVKLAWTVTDIAATYTSNKTWNPDTKTWVETKTVAAIADQTATFTLTNYSSKNVVANAKFTVEDAVKDTLNGEAAFDQNDIIVKTPVTQEKDSYAEADFTALKQTITATLKFNKDKFADLSAAASATKYGTYTITLSAKKDATVTVPTTKTTGLTYSNSEIELVNAGETDGGTWQYKLGDGEYSTDIPKAKDVGTYTVYYKLVGGDNYNDIAEENVQVTIAKANQSISAPTKASATSTSVTLNAISAGQGATKYGYSSSANSQPTSWQDSTSFTTGLTEDTTYYFFAKYEGNSNYNEVISTGTAITPSAWVSLQMPITTTTGSQTVNYLPVFADDSAPANITFAYKSDGAFTTINNPTMSSLAQYATTGNLYYKGSGTLCTVRSANGILWYDVFADDINANHPYRASNAYNSLQDGIKAQIASNGSETVENLCADDVTLAYGMSDNRPTINGVDLYTICCAYNADKNSSGFGGIDYCFWSCFAKSVTDVNTGIGAGSAFYFDYSRGYWDYGYKSQGGTCVLISRTFN